MNMYEEIRCSHDEYMASTCLEWITDFTHFWAICFIYRLNIDNYSFDRLLITLIDLKVPHAVVVWVL